LVPGVICIKESLIFLKQPTFLLIFTFTISLISFLKKIYGEQVILAVPRAVCRHTHYRELQVDEVTQYE